jgi:RNA recognition motif-containing protein
MIGFGLLSTPNPDTVFTGLAWATTTEELQALVSGFNVVSAEVVLGRDDRSRGFGLVEAQSVEDAEQIINSLNNTELNGRAMIVRFDNRGAN